MRELLPGDVVFHIDYPTHRLTCSPDAPAEEADLATADIILAAIRT